MGTTNTTQVKNPYRICFADSKPKEAQIARAVMILLETQGKPRNLVLMERWAQMLQGFSGDQLAESFFAVSLRATGWPTIGDITREIFDREFQVDYAWLLENLRRHSAAWNDLPALYENGPRELGGSLDDVPVVCVKHAIPAPQIPLRTVRALELFAAAHNTAPGLAKLSIHPEATTRPEEPAEAQRVRQALDKEFRAAWQIARQEELAG